MRGEQQFRELRERYPDGVVPLGTWTILAKELGCTRERVRQIASGLGFQITKERTTPTKRTCPSCGGSKSFYAMMCRKCEMPDHPMVVLECRICGKHFERPRVVHQRQMRARAPFESLTHRYQRAATASSGPFCSWDCRNKKGKLQ